MAPSIAAILAIQPVMVCGMIFFEKQQSTRGNSASQQGDGKIVMAQ